MSASVIRMSWSLPSLRRCTLPPRDATERFGTIIYHYYTSHSTTTRAVDESSWFCYGRRYRLCLLSRHTGGRYEMVKHGRTLMNASLMSLRHCR